MVVALCTWADETKPVTIDATDKAALEANDGKEVTVAGTIKKAAWSPTGKVMNVEFENSPLIAAVFEKNKEAINKAFDGDAAKKWTGAKVKLSGKLGKYGGKSKAMEGKPEIVISKPEQVVIEEGKKE
jgi:hypothetical protein